MRPRAQPLVAVASLAARRLRRRWPTAVGTGLAVAVAVGLVAAVSIMAALAREASERGRLTEWTARERLVQLSVRRDERQTARDALGDGTRRFARLGAPAGRSTVMLVAGPVSPADERGVRLVYFARDPPALTRGRRPVRCDPVLCEVAALAGRPAIGAHVRIGTVIARVVGRLRVRPAIAPSDAVLHGRAVVIPSLDILTGELEAAGAWAVLSASLSPASLTGRDAGELAAELRAAAARAERARPGVLASAPVEPLRAIDADIRAAQRRLLMVAAQAAMLLVAFLALLGVAARREAAELEHQLASFGGHRWQPHVVRALEVAVPAVAGAALALVLATGVAATLGVAALSLETLALTALLAAAAVGVGLVAAREPRRRAGAVDVSAVVGLGIVVWQAPAAGGGSLGVLLLVPTLGLIAGAVLVTRALPLGFRVLERLARRRALSARLALLGLARGGGLVAAATTFLAIALGTALFALNYRATLAAQVDDAAAFRAGASWRVSAVARPSTREPPTRVMRFPARISLAGRQETDVRGTLLALPSAQLAQVAGWRPGFADVPRASIAARLGADRARLTGRRVAREVRLWVRCDVAGRLVLELLGADQRFTRVIAGDVGKGWRRLRVRIPRAAVLGGITVSSPTPVFAAELTVGPLQLRTAAGGWTTLERFDTWVAATGRPAQTMPAIPVGLPHAPIRRGVRFRLADTGVPFIRPGYRVPDAVPALVSDELAARAVDGRLVVSVEGFAVPVRAIARGRLFPTVTGDPGRFAVVDYDTLFAVLNSYRPGLGRAQEAWYFGAAPMGVTSRRGLEAAGRRDSLATATSDVLALTAWLALVLATAGLILAAAGSLRAESGELVAWLALGASPATLAASLRLRILLVYAAGAVAAVAGSALALRLVAELVAVSAGGRTPLPPIEPHVAWAASAALLASSALTAAAVAWGLARLAVVRVRTRRIRA